MTFAEFQVHGDGQGRKQLQEAKDYMLAFARGEADQPWVVLGGPPGTGKTHLLVATTMVLVGQGVAAVYAKATDVARVLREQEDDRRLRYTHARCLALDDMLAEYRTEFTAQGFEELLEWRYEQRAPTILSTNADLSAFGPRLSDRLYELAELLLLSDVPSWRRR